jgi:hypothetical protein
VSNDRFGRVGVLHDWTHDSQDPAFGSPRVQLDGEGKLRRREGPINEIMHFYWCTAAFLMLVDMSLLIQAILDLLMTASVLKSGNKKPQIDPSHSGRLVLLLFVPLLNRLPSNTESFDGLKRTQSQHNGPNAFGQK